MYHRRAYLFGMAPRLSNLEVTPTDGGNVMFQFLRSRLVGHSRPFSIDDDSAVMPQRDWFSSGLGCLPLGVVTDFWVLAARTVMPPTKSSKSFSFPSGHRFSFTPFYTKASSIFEETALTVFALGSCILPLFVFQQTGAGTASHQCLPPFTGGQARQASRTSGRKKRTTPHVFTDLASGSPIRSETISSLLISTTKNNQLPLDIVNPFPARHHVD
ncbi:hypothetical protein B0T19DRAFT_174291 [Cercophora scortea]|uniref:Uncharacterized protein n=1 Tax=Cercophora scortea TaxID=314031 RepID=A0AAE0INV5_9PEZI|nr:hypothetical protein B0T19DRAFT_174291 [Cercophora scortea]